MDNTRDSFEILDEAYKRELQATEEETKKTSQTGARYVRPDSPRSQWIKKGDAAFESKSEPWTPPRRKRQAVRKTALWRNGVPTIFERPCPTRPEGRTRHGRLTQKRRGNTTYMCHTCERDNRYRAKILPDGRSVQELILCKSCTDANVYLNNIYNKYFP